MLFSQLPAYSRVAIAGSSQGGPEGWLSLPINCLMFLYVGLFVFGVTVYI